MLITCYEHLLPQLRRKKRLASVVPTTTDKDNETLKFIAKTFEEMRPVALSCVFLAVCGRTSSARRRERWRMRCRLISAWAYSHLRRFH